MDEQFEAIDAQSFLDARTPDPRRSLQGADLQHIFWRYKSLEKELGREKAFWKSTNDTLSRALSQVREQEQELEEKTGCSRNRTSSSRRSPSVYKTSWPWPGRFSKACCHRASPPGPAYRFSARCVPAREVGGDFYAYHPLGNGHFALAVGDVSDKGMSAALLMAISLAHFDSALSFTLFPHEVLAHLDRSLMRYTKATRQNCALCYVEIDGLTLHIANAGGIPPFIRRANGSVERLNIGGLPLGIGLGAQVGYESTTVTLAPDDVVILTSDGVVEAMTASGELFGFERLEQTIANGPAANPQAMLDYVMHEVASFVAGAEPHDDLTIVTFQIQAPVGS